MKSLIAILMLLSLVTIESKISKSKLIKDLETLAGQKTRYLNKYPNNLLYWDGEKFWCDCSNLFKALFNGRDINNKQKGSFQSKLVDPRDVTEHDLFFGCSQISTDFRKLKAGEFRLLYMSGHVGSYIGKEKKVGNRIVNVIECTPNEQLGNGVVYSYVDASGNRLKCKGCNPVSRKWTHHGRPDRWVSQ